MLEKESVNHSVSPRQPAAKTPDLPEHKSSRRGLWLIVLVFCASVVITLLTYRQKSIHWVEDYEAGVELAKQQNKPILLAFYKQLVKFCTDTFKYTYSDSEVIKYVEANFVPILINVDKQPKLAEKYKVGYYPSHFIKHPDNDKVFGPLLGYDPPELFIEKLKELSDEMNRSDK